MVTCRYHLEARRSSELKVKKGEWKINEDIRPILNCRINNLMHMWKAMILI